MREAAGPFTISLFTTPEALAIGPADLSVLVEQGGGGPVLLDADVALTLTPRDCEGPPIQVRLTHAAATNRLLDEVQISLPCAGVWQARLMVREGGREANIATELTVTEHSSRRGTIWLFALLPGCIVALFLWIQAEKHRAGKLRALQPV